MGGWFLAILLAIASWIWIFPALEARTSGFASLLWPLWLLWCVCIGWVAMSIMRRIENE